MNRGQWFRVAAYALLVVFATVGLWKLREATNRLDERADLNQDAIAFLCEGNAIQRGVLGQTVSLIESIQRKRPSPELVELASILSGYDELLADREECLTVQ